MCAVEFTYLQVKQGDVFIIVTHIDLCMFIVWRINKLASQKKVGRCCSNFNLGISQHKCSLDINLGVMLQRAVYQYALLPLVLMRIENQNVNCQVAFVQWWHNKESMTKTHSQVF